MRPCCTISKPYTEIVFYTVGSIDTSYEDYYIHKIEVSEKQFESIKTVIENASDESAIKKQSMLEVALLDGVIEIEMPSGCPVKNIKSNAKKIIDKIFTNVLFQFNGRPNEETVYSLMVGLLKRLDIPGIAERYKLPIRRRHKV